MIRLTPSGRRASPSAQTAPEASQHATHITELNAALKNPDIAPTAAALTLRRVWEISSEMGSALLTDAKADVIDNSSIKELALSYFLSGEQTELAKAWLISNYASALQRPSWAELNIALAQKDEATLIRLLDTVADWLPKFDRIEALHQTKQLATAQSLAYQLAEQRPDSVEANQRLTQLLDEQSSSARLFWANGNQSSVRYKGPRLEANFRISPTLAIETRASSSTLHNSDPNFPIALSNRESETEFGLRWLRDSGRITTSVLSRSSLTDSTGLRVDWKESFESKYNIQASLQWRAPTSETQGLRVYGYSNELKSSARYEISKREYVSGQVALTQFGLDGQGAIARGLTMNAEAGHLVRIDYPDITARISVARGRYVENARFSSAASAFLSGNAATNRGIFLPGNSSSFNAQLGLGASGKDRNHGGGLTPFAQVALSYDSLVGAGYNAAFGISTSVVGNDRLFIGGNFISSTPANPRASREFSAGYRLQF
jgi:polysaccharide biosynthesis protein PelB